MAGGNDIITNSVTVKPGKGTTEKKKRKRPSKKVPTTILEASSTHFMELVQKLTGSTEEKRAKLVSDASNSSSPSSRSVSGNAQQADVPSSQTCHQGLRSGKPVGYGDLDCDSSSHSNNYTSPHTHPEMPSLDFYHHEAETSEYYNNYPDYSVSSSRIADEEDLHRLSSSSEVSMESLTALGNETSPFSSQWRDQVGHQDYLFQVAATHA
ncbi:uncharacterized protein [Physcomitrium patens]|uniref:VQ domain-containing protein n=1 Tax=Physcomitrium patens TaxID=3218 RepID=A9SI24_PHYPA|nr:uncharacterized protein LOC112293718 [Physcomitrium patens]PNR38109.1 hypothetical protein PHYPA_021220 [Physcomitrium patens]|eukprot:XP_024399243.1 uncharacterized protein LOC112293718 [Physcomitrella patens]